MNDETRKHYDGLLLWARLTQNDFGDWYNKCYKVSSTYNPDGIFSSYEEMKQYENRNTD